MENLNWIDVTRYSQRNKDKINPTAWGATIGKIDIMIHRHIDYAPDVWLMSCSFIDLSKKLENKEIEAAKTEAVALVKHKIESQIADLQKQLGYF
ncbi:hypothetical protein [Paenibacillus sp. Leaf72]|uniref:hypothetical protein n=1 Tax=Paenibacillus sp. Leaf72 TaxID=1736234 RepID=UPI0006F80FDE|nr:hypothetical protein [Paenibacillus sp. Leaf72]KQN96904.1 hypothetical protein ASF12_22815 [Paenibacillus sp. Leaf72]